MRPAAKRVKKKKTSGRNARKVPAPNPFVALMQPVVIVPDDPAMPVIIADAGSIIERMNQRTLYRDRISPVTHTGDEWLVRYGKASAPLLGWITNKTPSTAMKPVQGPTFLVTSKVETALSAWDGFRLKIARTRKSSPSMWFAPWIVLHGKKYPRELREVTRLFGGKPIKNELFDARCARLFQLILHTEIDMSASKAKAISKKSGSKKTSKKEAPVEKVVRKTKEAVAKKIKKAKEEDAPVKKKAKSGKTIAKEVVAKSKSKEKAKPSKSGDFSARSRDFDEHIIKRLIQENPRRAGSNKAAVWDKLKKGMTVATFAKKGGSRSVVARYINNGWIKLLRPSGSKSASTDE